MFLKLSERKTITSIGISISISKSKNNKTGIDRFQDCCKAKATNALLQS